MYSDEYTFKRTNVIWDDKLTNVKLHKDMVKEIIRMVETLLELGIPPPITTKYDMSYIVFISDILFWLLVIF